MMIPKAVKSKSGKGTGGTGFRGAIDYVTEKADAVQTLNLTGPTTAAPSQMRLTANANQRVQKPAYHIVATWHEHERPSNDQMFDAGQRMLERLGAAEHQAVMAVHRDRDHHHIHVIVNRIHPETNKAFPLSNDFAKLEQAAREIEAEQGWSQDRGRFDVSIQEQHGKPTVELQPKPQEHWESVQESRASGRTRNSDAETQREKRTGERPLKDTLLANGMKKRVQAALDNDSWDDVHRDLAALGLEYKPHGSGARLYVRGTDDFMPTSHVGKPYSHKKMLGRLGEFREAPQHTPQQIDNDAPDATATPRSDKRSDTHNDIQQPSSSKAQRYKVSLISSTYRGLWLSDKTVANIKYVDIASDTPRVRFADGMQVRDQGDKVTATNTKDSDMAAESLVEMARGKGWDSINLRGQRDVVLAATRKATERGIDVANADQEMKAVIRHVQREQADRPEAGRADSAFESRRSVAFEQAEANDEQRAARREAQRQVTDQAAEQRREAAPILRDGDQTIRQATREAINDTAKSEYQRVDHEHPRPDQRADHPDYHEHLHQRRDAGDQDAGQELQNRKLRQTDRDQHDELEQIKRLDLRAVAERQGYALDARATREAGRGQHVMRRGGDTIKLREPDSERDWTFVNNKTGTAGGVIQFYQAETGANLGRVRRDLRPMVGREPQLQTVQHDQPRPSPGPKDHTAIRQQWERARSIGSPGPDYARQRGISDETIQRFSDQIKVSERGNLLFAHRDDHENITGFEVKGPDWTGFAKGGSKQATVLGDPSTAQRVVITESGIDALSKAQIEQRDDTLYLSTGGGMSQRTAGRLQELASGREAVLAFDSDQGGDQLARRTEKALAGVRTAGITRDAPAGKDWNEELQARQAQQAQQQAVPAPVDINDEAQRGAVLDELQRMNEERQALADWRHEGAALEGGYTLHRTRQDTDVVRDPGGRAVFNIEHGNSATHLVWYDAATGQERRIDFDGDDAAATLGQAGLDRTDLRDAAQHNDEMAERGAAVREEDQKLKTSRAKQLQDDLDNMARGKEPKDSKNSWEARFNDFAKMQGQELPFPAQEQQRQHQTQEQSRDRGPDMSM